MYTINIVRINDLYVINIGQIIDSLFSKFSDSISTPLPPPPPFPPRCIRLNSKKQKRKFSSFFFPGAVEWFFLLVEFLRNNSAVQSPERFSASRGTNKAPLKPLEHHCTLYGTEGYRGSHNQAPIMPKMASKFIGF